MRTLWPIVLSLLILVAAGVRPTDAAGHRPRDAPTAVSIQTTCPVCRAAARLGMRMTPLRRVFMNRCGCPEAVTLPMFPRGDVREEDLFIRVDLSVEYEKGFLGAWTGMTVLGRDPFDSPYLSTTMPLPDAWRRGLRPGALVFWEVEDVDRPTEKTWFRYVDLPREAARRLAAVDVELGAQESDVRALLRARVFQDHRLFVAAWREVQPLLKAEPGEPHALAIEHEILGALGLGDDCLRLSHQMERLHAYDAHAAAGERCFLDVDEPPPKPIIAPVQAGCGGSGRIELIPPPTESGSPEE